MRASDIAHAIARPRWPQVAPIGRPRSGIEELLPGRASRPSARPAPSAPQTSELACFVTCASAAGVSGIL
jgi:hypothetical protein